MRAVLERDFVAEASRPRAFLFRGAVAAVVAAAGGYALHARWALLRDTPDVVARAVFGGGAQALLAILALLAPAAVVGSILEERQRGTLPLVLAAPVGPRAFALAKMTARGLAILGWALAALFPLTLAYTMGGVGAGQILDLLLLGAAVVLECAAWATLVSCLSTRTATAVVLAYLLPALRWGICAVLYFALLHPGYLPAVFTPSTPESRAAALLVATTTPFPGAARMEDPEEYGSALRSFLDAPDEGPQTMWRIQGRVWMKRTSWAAARPAVFIGSNGSPSFAGAPALPSPLPPPFDRPAPLNLAFAAAAALAVLLFAGRRLAVEEEPRSSRFLRFLRRRGSIRPPGDGANPVAWKERLLLNAAASRPLYYTVLGLLLAAELLYLAAWAILAERGRFLWAGLHIATAHLCLLGLIGILGGAAAMAQERAVGTLDLLRCSPLAPAEIVGGKVQGLLRGLGLVGLLPLLHLVLLAAGGFIDPITGLVAGALEAVFVLTCALAGIACGLGAPRMGIAVRRGILAYGALFLGVPAAAGLVGMAPGAAPLGEFLFAAWPPALFESCLAATLTAFHGTWLDAFDAFGAGGPPAAPAWAVLWASLWGIAVLLAWRLAPGLLARRFAREAEVGG